MAKTPKIEHVAELIRHLVQKEDAQPKEHSAYARVFSQLDEGTLFLNRADSYAYSETLNRLVEQFGKSEALSPRAIEQALQRAIFSAIDIAKKRQERPLEEGIQNAMAELLHELRQPAMTYHCYVPVGGVELKGLPYRFGPVTFLTFNMHQLRKFHKTVQLQSVSDDEKKLRDNLLKELKRSGIWNSSCAMTEVRAQDPRCSSRVGSPSGKGRY
jgi:hypothetical protein